MSRYDPYSGPGPWPEDGVPLPYESPSDDELIVARLRALVREHPPERVPVVELAELARILGVDPP